MKRHKPQSYASLENDLLSKIREIRAEYLFNDNDTEETKQLQNDIELDSMFASEIPTSVRLLGPDFGGVQLVASQRMIELLGYQCIGETRGSCQSLEVPHQLQQRESNSIWKSSAKWERPNVWLRQGKSSIEADASCLYHWSQSLLCPESKSANAKVIFIHPKRIDDNADMDDQFLSEFQSIYELCGFGLAPLFKRFTYRVHENSWDRTAREISLYLESIVEEIAKDASLLQSSELFHYQQQQQQDNSYSGVSILNGARGFAESSNQKIYTYLALVVWPTQAWHRTKTCLAGCSNIRTSATTRMVIHVVPEDLVLITRKRKSRLIGIASGCYANLSNGALFVLPERSSPSTSTSGGEDSPRSTGVAVTKWIHVGISQSKDGRWVTFAWCNARGESLSVRALQVCSEDEEEVDYVGHEKYQRRKGYYNPLLMKLLGIISSETNGTLNFAIITHDVPDDFVDMSMLPGSQYNIWLCTLQNPSQFKCTSIMDDGVDNEELRQEMDDLAFLSSIAEYPSKGMLRGMLLGSLSATDDQQQQHKTDKGMMPPLHLRCALLLAQYMDGLLPA
jgi:hypothetical protein